MENAPYGEADRRVDDEEPAADGRPRPAHGDVLIVGHSHTFPLIARALGFAAAADMPDWNTIA